MSQAGGIMKKARIAVSVSTLALMALLIGATSGNSAGTPSGSDRAGQGRLSTSARSDRSRPLRDIPAKVTRRDEADENENPPVRRAPPAPRGATAPRDAAIQKILSPNAMPTPIQNFEGQFNEFGPIPPDTNGDVGRSHYIQIVNSGFTIYNKTGTI